MLFKRERLPPAKEGRCTDSEFILSDLRPQSYLELRLNPQFVEIDTFLISERFRGVSKYISVLLTISFEVPSVSVIQSQVKEKSYPSSFYFWAT